VTLSLWSENKTIAILPVVDPAEKTAADENKVIDPAGAIADDNKVADPTKKTAADEAGTTSASDVSVVSEPSQNGEDKNNDGGAALS
jgi:hypothetical protein